MAWNMGIDLSDNHHSGWHYSDTAGRAKDCGCAGNMREINREKFKCRKCSGTEVCVSADHKGSGRDVPGRRPGPHDAAGQLTSGQQTGAAAGYADMAILGGSPCLTRSKRSEHAAAVHAIVLQVWGTDFTLSPHQNHDHDLRTYLCVACGQAEVVKMKFR